jgi:hypothetical protein
VISRASTEQIASVDKGDNSDIRASMEGVMENEGTEGRRKLDEYQFIN